MTGSSVDIGEALVAAAAAMSAAEVIAVALAVAYLLLAVRQNIWCWAAALASTAIYMVIFFEAALVMESALQVFYAAMAVYGWWQWRQGGPDHNALAVSRWTPRRHVLAVGAIAVATLISGALLDAHTDAAMPYLDSFTTWAAMLTTWMVARKILENWVYWFVIDSVSIYLYVSRELYLTALLFVAYLVIIVFGNRAWRRDLDGADADAIPAPQNA